MPDRSANVDPGDTALATDLNYVRELGLRGWLSKEASAITISSGVASISSKYSGIYMIAAESGTADDLDDISGGADGEVIWLVADSGDTITVKHASGKILLMGDRDFVLYGNTMLQLRYDGTDWYQVEGGAGRLGALCMTIGNGVTAIVSGDYQDIPYLPADFYILGYYGGADQSGTLPTFLRSDTWNVKPDSGDNIAGSAEPDWSSAQFISDTTLTGWTRLIVAGKNLYWGADGGATNITKASLILIGIWMP